jgi:peptidoglycan/LPS O-acetylase OafA/YrhL
MNHPPSSSKSKLHFTFLDDLRGIAVISVFLGHIVWEYFLLTGTSFKRPWIVPAELCASLPLYLKSLITGFALYPFTLGWIGVPIFFVISGFCIHLSFQKVTVDPFTTFYIRRFFRIYPPYLFALLLFAVVFPDTRLAFTKLNQWAQLITHVSLIHNYIPWCIWGINGNFWSIAVEVQLYVIFPALLFATRFWGWRNALVFAGLIELMCQVITIYHQARFGTLPIYLCMSPLFYWFSWSIGAGLAQAYLDEQTLRWFQRVPAWAWLVSGMATAEFPAHAFSFTFFALFAANILWHMLQKGRIGPTKTTVLARHFRTAGLWSYSIYLVHHPILKSVLGVYLASFPHLKGQPLLYFVVGASSWIIIFPMSGLMYRFVEIPSVSLGKIFLSRWTTRVQQPAIA